MPPHLRLPAPSPVGSRRAIPNPVGGPARNRPAHGRQLKRELAATTPAVARALPMGVDPRLVIKVRARTRISESSFDNKGVLLLGESSGWEYYVLPGDHGATDFNAAIDRYTQTADGRTFFDSIDELLPYGPEDRSGPGIPTNLGDLTFPTVVDINLWPAASGPDAAWRLADVRSVVGQNELGSDEQPAFLLVRARVTLPTLQALLNLAAVESVRLPPTPFLSPTDWAPPLASDLARPQRREGVVGIVDDGVHTGHALLEGLVETFEIPTGRIWNPPTQHGTMVAGLAAYGDFEVALRDGIPLPQPIRVLAARVLEPNSRSGGSATFPTDQPEHRVIEEAIRELHRRGAAVVNLSFSDRDNYSGPHVDQRTELLDTLARELDLVIVTCAGNVRGLPTGLELHRDHPGHLLEPANQIAEPAIAANALTVGSLARSAQGSHPDGESPPEMRAVSAADQISPFSRTGPGFQSGSVKPDLVHYGGNVVTQAVLSTRAVTVDNPGAGAVSLALPGPFSAGGGTSYAAPRVARIAAVVRADYPEASGNLTRALVGLSASVPEPHGSSQATVAGQTPAAQLAENLRFVGYGMPDERRAVESIQSRVVMMFDGAIDCDTSVIHEIPIPEEFANGAADRRIAVSLAFDPPARRHRREYLAAKMKVDFFRAMDLAAVQATMARQIRDDAVPLPADRRRGDKHLKPSSTAVLRSTLQVRRWKASDSRSLDPDDGDTYFLVVTHVSEPWAQSAFAGYTSQKYAIAVELEDRSRAEINLFSQVQARLERSRVRTEARP